MARIRTIKPEFWASEQVMELSRDARLLFIGIWNFCDDGGNHSASLKTLKAEIFPGDDLTSTDIRRMVDELLQQGLLAEYEVDGKSYWHVTGWKHQKVDKPNYKHPAPPANPHREPIRRTFGEQSSNGSRTFDEHSPPEGKVRESKVRESSSSSSSVVEDSGSGPDNAGAPGGETRIGDLCKRLRHIGIRASPDLFRDAKWERLLQSFDNEAIAAEGQAKRAATPNKSITAAYLVPVLEERLQQQQHQSGGIHASRQPSRYDRNAAILAEASGGYTGPGDVIEASARIVD